MNEKPVAIIGAMPVEIEALLEVAEIEKTEEIASMTFHLGTLCGMPIVTAVCGAGKVNSALCAQVMIDHFSPRLVLNIGVAGGLGPVKIGDVVIATHCCQHDYDLTADGEHTMGEVPVPPVGDYVRNFPCDKELSDWLADAARTIYPNVYRGPIATGDQFIASNEKANRLHEDFGALACEMEGASIAHACLLNGVPCMVLRTISDNGNDDAVVDFPTFAKQSAHQAQQLLTRIVSEL